MRNAAADEIDIDADRVTVETPFLGGGFGRRSEPDAARQAARVAKALAGRPVKLFWDREEDMRHDTYRPAGTCRMTARLDGDGRPVAWHHRSAGQSVLADYMSRIRPGAPLPTADATQVEGAEDIAYAIPHIRVEHVTTEPLVPVGWWRSVGNSLNAFFVESFIDELAHNAGADPYEYRRALLADRPRDRAVLDLVAKKSGWGDKPPPGRGRGLAVHKSYESYVAQVVEISVTDGEIRLHKVTCAVDCGTVVHPDTVVAQMESAVTFGATAALFGRITIDQGRVVEGNFPDYDMIRMETMPENRRPSRADRGRSGRHRRGRDPGDRARDRQRGLRAYRQTRAGAAVRHRGHLAPTTLSPPTVEECRFMRIGLPKEIKTHEYRVAILPDGVRALIADGPRGLRRNRRRRGRRLRGRDLYRGRRDHLRRCGGGLRGG